MHEQAGALDVGEELVPEPGAGARALDQPRNVGDHELAVVELERAEHRLERGERVVGDLRLGAGQARQQRGLAGVRQADQADVGEQLELERDPRLIAGQPALGEPRRLMGRPGEALVPAAARAAAGDDRALARTDEVVPGAVGARPAPRCRAARAISSVSPSAPCRSEPWPWPPRFALKCDAAAEALEVAQRVVADEHDVAAATAVAAVGAALGDVGLAAEAEAAVAAGAGLHVDARTIVHDMILTCPIPCS